VEGNPISDVDSGAVEGIAVTSVDDANGTWQYSINGGTNWFAIGPVSNTSARVLADGANDRIRFVPDGDFNGTPTLGFRAWDTTDGKSSGDPSVDVSSNGTTTPYSSATASVSITVNAVNDAPVADDDSISISEDGPESDDLTAILLDGDTDVDIATNGATISITGLSGLSGLTGLTGLTGVTGKLTFESIKFDPDGKFESLDDNSNLVSPFNVPDTTENSFVYTLTDTGFPLPALSDTATVTITIIGVNDAPTGADKTVLATEDIDFVFAASDFGFADVDTGDALVSIKITTLETAGALKVDGADVSLNQVIPVAKLTANFKYVPVADADISSLTTFQFTVNDGTTDSVAANTITVNVTPVNDAPVLVVAGSPVLSAINEDATNPPGNTVASIIASAQPPDYITEVDTVFVEGIAVTAVDDTNGTWQFSTNAGSSWAAFGSVSGTTARLLAADNTDNKIRFVPAGDFNGAPTITFRAWDQTTGTDGLTANTSPNGGTTAYSTATDSASITVNAINDEPNIANPGNVTIDEDDASEIVNLTGINSDGSAPVFGDEAGQTLTVTVSSSDTSIIDPPAPTYSSADTTGSVDVTPKADANGVVTITVTVTDDGGTANAGDDDTVSVQFTVTVNAINDEPSFVTSAQTVNEDSGAASVGGFTTLIPDGSAPVFGDEAGQTATYTVSNNLNAIFSVQPAVSPSGTLTYTPKANANGVATVTISVQDSGGTPNGGDDTSPDQTFDITVTAVNDNPTANNESIDQSITEDETNNADLTAELIAAVDDVDLDSALNFPVTEVITIVAVGTPNAAKGSATASTVLYNPNGAFNNLAEGETEDDVFSYTAQDQGSEQSTALATVTIDGTNDGPTGNDDNPRSDAFDSARGTTLVVSSASGVLANDTDPDQNGSDPDDTLSAKIVLGSFSSTKLQSVTVETDGGFTVVPVSTFAGEATFQYTVTDLDGTTGEPHSPVTSATATATVSFYKVEFSRTLYSDGEDAQPKVTDAFADSAPPDTDPDTLFVDMQSANSGEGLIEDYTLTESGGPTTDLYFDNIKVSELGTTSTGANPRLVVQIDPTTLTDTVTVFYRDVQDSATVEKAPGRAFEPLASDPLRFNSDRYVAEETADLGLLDISFVNEEQDQVSVYVRSSSTPAGYLATLVEEAENEGTFETVNPITLTTFETIPSSNQLHIAVGDNVFATYQPGSFTWSLTNTNDFPVTISVGYGIPGDIPVTGDFDGIDEDNIGVFRQSSGQWFLSNQFAFPVDINTFFGIASDRPVVGDWDRDGDDNIGVYRPSTGQWFLSSTNDITSIDIITQFGIASDRPVVGDWDGDGDDNIGVYRPSTGQWFLSSTNDVTSIDIITTFGVEGDIPVVGDWDNNPTDTIGFVRVGAGTEEATPSVIDSTPPSEELEIIGFETNTPFDCDDDLDLDGVCDEWIVPGVGGDKIEFTINGALYTEGCKPLLVDSAGAYALTGFANPSSPVCPENDRKQIFVEIDYMPGHKPPQVVMENIIDMYANADVENINTSTGVDLFVTVDQVYDRHIDQVEFSTGDIANPGLDEFKQAFFGTAAEQARSDAAAFLTGKFLFYRQGVGIHTNVADPTVSGQAEIGGNDFWVHGGALAGNVGSDRELELTYAHEFGHTLSLLHGGADNVVCKPNYLSVMNYMFQDAAILPNFKTDYSREALLDLVETNLDEFAGIQPEALDSDGAVIETKIGGEGSFLTPLLVDTGDTNIDFDRSSSIESGVSENLNFFDDIDAACENSSTLTTLTGFDDWANIEIPFRDEPHYADGVHTSSKAHKDRGGTPGQSPSTSVDHNTPVANPLQVIIPAVAPVEFDITGSDPNGDALDFTIGARLGGGFPPFGTAVIIATDGSSSTVRYTPDTSLFVDSDQFSFFVTDDSPSEKFSSDALVNIILNRPPSGDTILKLVNEDDTITFDLTGTDPDGDSLSFFPETPLVGTLDQPVPGGAEVTYDPPDDFFGATSFGFTVNDGIQDNDLENSPGQVTIIVAPEPAADTSEVIVLDVDPQIIKINVPTSVTFTYTDDDLDEPHFLDITWGDGSFERFGPLFGDGVDPIRTFVFVHTYTRVDVYRMTVSAITATDIPNTNTQDFLLSVYDPDAGFITGGGRYKSPSDGSAFDFTEFPEVVTTFGLPEIIDIKPNFGFVSKYEAGETTPKGNTNFVYNDKTDSWTLHFKSKTQIVLVTENNKAQYRGCGDLTINGVQIFGSVGDPADCQWDYLIIGKDSGGKKNDRARVKIWDNTISGQPTDGATIGVIYDSERGVPEDDPTDNKVTNGGIMIHDPGTGGGSGAEGGGDGPGSCREGKIWNEERGKCVKDK